MSKQTETKPAVEPAYILVSREWAEAATTTQDQLLRLRADFDNFRKRQIKERDDSLRYANESLLSDLIPIIDNFDLGMKAAANATDAKSIYQGLSMVLVQIQRFLSDNGVTAIDAVGKPFDPTLHEAVDKKQTTEVKDGYVLEQHRKGYQLYGRLIRPATVVVAQSHAEAPETKNAPAS